MPDYMDSHDCVNDADDPANSAALDARKARAAGALEVAPGAAFPIAPRRE